MRTAVLLAAGALVAVAVWYVRDEVADMEVPEVVDDAVEGAAQWVDEFTGGVMQLSAMSKVTDAIVADRNVQAFLRVIRRGEGTADAGGYSRIFGGSTFEGYADHPRRTVKASGYTSSAAGAYQALASTWDETKRIMALQDFSPRSQDRFAVGRIAARGALGDVIAGRFEDAVRKCAKEWASLPFSPYGQPVISMAVATQTFIANGGVLA